MDTAYAATTEHERADQALAAAGMPAWMRIAPALKAARDTERIRHIVLTSWIVAVTGCALHRPHYGLSRLLLEVFFTPGIDDICLQGQRQLMRNELARLYHHRTHKWFPPGKLCREIPEIQ